MRFIGDVHGKYDRYKKIIENCEGSVQVGDMGVGFFVEDYHTGRRALANPPYDAMVAGNHRFIRGNHDNPNTCRNHTQWIPDGKVENDILFVGGAWSIDRDYRTEGLNWWSDEQLSISEFQVVIDTACTIQPKIIVSHDCPLSVVPHLFNKEPIRTCTQQALDVILEDCRPEIWIFGHWHQNVDVVFGGTRFICLDELCYIDLDV